MWKRVPIQHFASRGGTLANLQHPGNKSSASRKSMVFAGARPKTAPYYTRKRRAGRFFYRRISCLRAFHGSHLSMKPGTLTHTIAVLLSSVSALFVPNAPAAGSGGSVKLSKKASKPVSDTLLKVDPYASSAKTDPPPLAKPGERFPWKKEIVTTVFWIGEKPTANNPTPNRSSSWDANWTKSYGGFDDPDRADRRDFMPANFTPRQNPFYVALPYNDKSTNGHRAEAPRVVPWFKEAYQGPAVSTCKGRWIAIRKGNKTVYAQWEDAGPFRTDHWQYVFGNERPKPNLNRGAGLDVSPAVRDYLGLQETDVTDWRFVEFSEVPHGPWSKHGDNNTFVMMQRRSDKAMAAGPKRGGLTILP
jgi:hypothetical protein